MNKTTMEEYKPEVKRAMLFGKEGALDSYQRMLHRYFLISDDPELATFVGGKGIVIPPGMEGQQDTKNYHRIRNIIASTHTRYVRRLLEETHDGVLLERMADAGIRAIKVFEPKKVYTDLARCLIKADDIHALWLINVSSSSGYFMTDNDKMSQDTNEGIRDETLEKIAEGDHSRLDFFKHDSKSKLFLKSKDNPWGGREVARNLEFYGLISHEEPITPVTWFNFVLNNFDMELQQQTT